MVNKMTRRRQTLGWWLALVAALVGVGGCRKATPPAPRLPGARDISNIRVYWYANIDPDGPAVGEIDINDHFETVLGALESELTPTMGKNSVRLFYMEIWLKGRNPLPPVAIYGFVAPNEQFMLEIDNDCYLIPRTAVYDVLRGRRVVPLASKSAR
jgi:hypothetical protein